MCDVRWLLSWLLLLVFEVAVVGVVRGKWRCLKLFDPDSPNSYAAIIEVLADVS
jgi:hypothetical protein